MIIPPMIPISDNATEEERVEAYNKYKAELIKCNPTHFNSDGSIKEYRVINPLAVIFNPFIWLWNFFKYSSHMETFRYSVKYERYDFKNDTKYIGWWI